MGKDSRDVIFRINPNMFYSHTNDLGNIHNTNLSDTKNLSDSEAIMVTVYDYTEKHTYEDGKVVYKVESDNKCGVIDEFGNQLVPVEYDSAYVCADYLFGVNNFEHLSPKSRAWVTITNNSYYSDIFNISDTYKYLNDGAKISLDVYTKDGNLVISGVNLPSCVDFKYSRALLDANLGILYFFDGDQVSKQYDNIKEIRFITPNLVKVITTSDDSLLIDYNGDTKDFVELSDYPDSNECTLYKSEDFIATANAIIDRITKSGRGYVATVKSIQKNLDSIPFAVVKGGAVFGYKVNDGTGSKSIMQLSPIRILRTTSMIEYLRNKCLQEFEDDDLISIIENIQNELSEFQKEVIRLGGSRANTFGDVFHLVDAPWLNRSYTYFELCNSVGVRQLIRIGGI